MEDNDTEKQPNLGPYCLQYKLHNKINSMQHNREAEENGLNDGSLEKNYANCKTVMRINKCVSFKPN